jgi:glycosyltransferase involved in cell wall biosynthesis
MAGPVPVMLMVRELGIGGCERDLAKLVKAIDRSKFSPHVGCFISEGLRSGELREAGVPIVRFPVRSFQSWSAIQGARQMGRYLREHQIKLVHCFDVPTVIFGIPTAYLYRTPAIISAQLGERELFSKTYHRLLRWTDRLADVVVANSRYIQQYLIEREHIPAARTYLCHNGFEPAVFHTTAEPKPGAVADASLVIGAVCALRPEKRLDLLLRAFAQIRHLQSGLKLLIVGSGAVLPQLTALSRELGIAADCVFEPSKTDVPPWMHALDIYVMCSETESFPNALLEAMACGCAVVGSRVGGVPELITDGVSGLLFESLSVDSLSAALAKLVTDQALRRRLSAQAAVAARNNFSMEVNARRNEALYTTLLGRKGIQVESLNVNVKSAPARYS